MPYWQESLQRMDNQTTRTILQTERRKRLYIWHVHIFFFIFLLTNYGAFCASEIENEVLPRQVRNQTLKSRYRELQHGKASRWPQKPPFNKPYSGLTLKITNALPESLNSFFDNAVKAWQSGHSLGTKDAMRLEVTNIPPPSSNSWPNCNSGIDGEIIMCGHNYGNTRWIGMEISTIRAQKILKSRVKLNTYHLLHQSDVFKQYVMCHEMGHSMGLKHVDEDFYNQHTGSCLDYTIRKMDKCQRPNVIDYEQLVSMYGALPLKSLRQSATPLPPASEPKESQNNETETGQRLLSPPVLDEEGEILEELEAVLGHDELECGELQDDYGILRYKSCDEEPIITEVKFLLRA